MLPVIMQFREVGAERESKKTGQSTEFLAVTMAAIRIEHAAHGEEHENLSPESTAFLHAPSVVEGKDNEQALHGALASNDEELRKRILETAPATVQAEWAAVEERAQELQTDVGHLHAHSAHAEAASPIARPQLLGEGRVLSVNLSQKYEVAVDVTAHIYLTAAAMRSKTETTRVDLLLDAQKAGFSQTSVLSTANYLDEIYGTNIAMDIQARQRANEQTQRSMEAAMFMSASLQKQLSGIDDFVEKKRKEEEKKKKPKKGKKKKGVKTKAQRELEEAIAKAAGLKQDILKKFGGKLT